MSRRYVVTEREKISETTDVWGVEDTKTVYPYRHTDVWVRGDRINCASCFGPLQAMLSSCEHASAVRRHLKKLEASPEDKGDE